MKRTYIFFLIIFFPTIILAQKEPETVIIDFYSWYFNSIKNRLTKEYQPFFDADNNGMTTINTDKYIKNLKSLNFSDKLIKNEIASYKACLAEIGKVKFKELNEKFTDISNYEDIGCDFFNSFRWTWNMLGDDRIKVVETKEISDKKKVLRCELSTYNEQEKKNDFCHYFYATMIYENNKWLIDAIEPER